MAKTGLRPAVGLTTTAALALAALALTVLTASAAAQKPSLPERYKKWLDEEVVYIITPVEREVFLKLGSDRERDLFIEAFWKQRDPNPMTAENEFKKEHYRRLEYADRYLGRDAPRPGWRTDRGRMYIILGEPNDIQRFESKSSVYDCEAWFYQGKTEAGLPAGFYLLFFRPGGQGEYRLYSPSQDGPQALLAGYMGDAVNYAAAYQKLRETEPTLADLSLSLIPGEENVSAGRPSLSSDLLIQRIAGVPFREVESNYARKFLLYKDVIEVDYTANYIDSESLIRVFRDASGMYFVHYAVEPRRLSVNQYNDRYFTTLKVNGRVSAADGRLVHQFDRTVSIELDEEQMKSAGRAPFDFQDMIPLVPGDYNLSVLLKNEASKEFTSTEAVVRVPGGEGVRLMQPLLGYKVTRLAPDQQRMKPFRVGPFQVYGAPNRVFTAGETLAVVFQLDNLTPELVERGSVRLAFYREDQVFRELNRDIKGYGDLPNALEEVSLKDFPPAHYRLEVSVQLDGGELVKAREEFDLTFAEAVPRPWFSTRVQPDAGHPMYLQILGSQLYNLGRYSEARLFLERAYERGQRPEELVLTLARAKMALDDSAGAEALLMPLLAGESAAGYEVYTTAAELLRSGGRFEQSLQVLEKALARFGVNAELIRALGEDYLGLGRKKEAQAAFEKSLELNPDQPDLKKKLEELRKKGQDGD
jgi:GWxTD domain-containing protein